MAGNRLQRTGSIFARLSGLIRADAIKPDDIPIWYNIYKAFPPKHNPDFGRPVIMKDIKPIYYPEDIIRGKFSKVYGNVGQHNLVDEKGKFISQRFVEKYVELEKSGKYSNEDSIFDAAEKALADDGFILERIDKPMITDGEKTEESRT